MAVTIQGLDRLTKRLKELPDAATRVVVAELQAGAIDIRNDAVAKVPVFDGFLKNSIAANNSLRGAEVVVNANYGGYVEFGTGPRAMRGVSSRWSKIAMELKGRKSTGSLDDFIRKMTEWVRKKKLAGRYSVKTRKRVGNKGDRQNEDLRLAKFIVYKILKNGMYPQPYFFPAFERNERKILDNCRKALARYIKSNR